MFKVFNLIENFYCKSTMWVIHFKFPLIMHLVFRVKFYPKDRGLDQNMVITSYRMKKINCIETNMSILGCLNTHLGIIVLEIINSLLFLAYVTTSSFGWGATSTSLECQRGSSKQTNVIAANNSMCFGNYKWKIVKNTVVLW